MDRWIELRCPACAAPAGRMRRVRAAIGAPFERCAACGTFVSRAPFQEWDLWRAGARAAYLFEKGAFALALGSLPGLAYLLTATVRRQALDLGVALALFGGGALLAAFISGSALASAVRRSRARMSDPMYRARMVEFGRRDASAARERRG